MKKLFMILIFFITLIGNIAAQSSKVAFEISYQESYDFDGVLLGSKTNVQETYILNMDTDEFTHVTKRDKQVYDIIDIEPAEDKQSSSFLVRSRISSKLYHFVIRNTDDENHKQLIRVYENSLDFFYGKTVFYGKP